MVKVTYIYKGNGQYRFRTVVSIVSFMGNPVYLNQCSGSVHFDADPDSDSCHEHFYKNYGFAKQKKNVQILKKLLIFMLKLDEPFRNKNLF